MRMGILFLSAVFLAFSLAAQEGGDLIVRYVTLQDGDMSKVTIDGTQIECKHDKGKLQIKVLSAPTKIEVEKKEGQKGPEIDEGEKKWTYPLPKGSIESKAWKDLPKGYYVEVITPLGIVRANEYLYWNTKERRLNLVDDKELLEKLGSLPAGIAKNTEGEKNSEDDDSFLPPPVKFTGTISFVDDILQIDSADGGGTLELPSTKEVWFHQSPDETGVQYVSKKPMLMPEDIGPDLREIEGLPEEVRDVTPGQS